MKKDIKNALKFFYSYLLTIIIFVMFIPIVLNISKDNTVSFLVGYSFLVFLMLFSMVYSDAKKIASIERKPTCETKAYPFKGFVLGLMGFAPVIAIGLIYPLIRFDSDVFNRIKHVALNTLLSPFYFIIKAGGESAAVYVISFLIVPVIASIGYYFGYKNYEIKGIFRRSTAQNVKK